MEPLKFQLFARVLLGFQGFGDGVACLAHLSQGLQGLDKLHPGFRLHIVQQVDCFDHVARELDDLVLGLLRHQVSKRAMTSLERC